MAQRTRHCYICNKCVENFDHHCDWLHQCIGKNNCRVFLAFLCTMTVFMSFILFINLDALFFNFGQKSLAKTNGLALFGDSPFYNIWVSFSITLLFTFLLILFLIPLTSLLILHIKNLY